jgi:hypothetical protein
MPNAEVLTKITIARVGRDTTTGRFITVEEARKRPCTTVVETVRVPPPKRQ